ncbi:chemotaxis protein CheA [Altererythrobacter salegens]|uniref:Chemotaxis protein CheA n=1 Tax=Croceibacterium salegens TaxID=1737568 RepID=A0A6I4SUL2_9SPHN|nr:chemotaxis protein CheW [Croceibacterium salegens]MXO59804.1 chemotaxis protein CheA [Croceibacterium salegens]
MDDLLADFIAEARDMMEALSGEIVAWENDPADKDRLDAIFRFVHTVKGNCGFFDFPRLETLSHAAEDALADCRAGRRTADKALVSAVLAVIDRIAEMVDAIGEGAELPGTDDEALIAALAEGAETAEAPSKEAAPTSNRAKRQSAAPRTIRLPVDLLDRVMGGVSDMAVARNDLARRLAQAEGETGLEAPFNRLSAILVDLSEAITRIRMQRIDTLFAGFPRMVRDLSHELGKQVMVEVESGDVEIDREMIEVVRDPMVHIIRNAIDHGIEKPAERLTVGKREIGSLTITARQTGSEIRIGIVDDGKGIDGEKLVAKAISAGLITAEEAAALTPRERNMLICQPGLSTAKEVTSVSGRGVGMDVVRANIERIGGSLVIDSTPGSGTRMMLNIPLTLSIVPSLTIGIAGHTFALPRSYVEEIVRNSGDEMDSNRMGGRKFITLRGQRIPCVGLEEVLGLKSTCPEDARLYVLIKLVGGDVFGLAVDAIHNHEELVVKPIAPVLMSCGLYVGTTQLDDGSPVPMLDIAGVARSAGMISEVKDRTIRTAGGEVREEEKALQPALLFVGFDGGERAIDMDSVRRIEKLPVSAVRRERDGTAQIVIDGKIVPFLGVAGELPEDMVAMFRIGAEDREIAYAYERMIDLVEYEPDTVSKANKRTGSRLALIDGRPVDVLDEARLLADHAGRVAEGA